MSKIQKALEILRNRNKADPTQQKSRVSTSSQSGAGGAAQRDGQAGGQWRQRAYVRPRYLPEGGTVDEKLPDFSISVDLETLRDQGLQPQETDLDLVAEEFRHIKRPILNIAFGAGVPEIENANVIMLSSALPQTGKTFCSFNLATSLARERDVGAVLVDADVLKPNMSRALGLDDRVGLIDYLLESSIDIDDILVATNLYGIVVIPAGRQHDEATELLASRRMKQFVTILSERFRARAIVVDAPPLLLTNEAHVLAELMGQIILVIEAGASTQESVTQALESLNRNKPINAILNKARRGVLFEEYAGYDYYSMRQ